ncbi:hypothetical protein L2E82_00168 [Cichorium intybus]|uniref:Uncharacterized protein n=1 Tax=Cichorium intybus TaxID=13427 RepID=A0ACB9GXE6_CICIN|nr:hypothetical protein L2E82_00168 [Cichorium intybus]
MLYNQMGHETLLTRMSGLKKGQVLTIWNLFFGKEYCNSGRSCFSFGGVYLRILGNSLWHSKSMIVDDDIHQIYEIQFSRVGDTSLYLALPFSLFKKPSKAETNSHKQNHLSS